jgi:hypothetical protein
LNGAARLLIEREAASKGLAPPLCMPHTSRHLTPHAHIAPVVSFFCVHAEHTAPRLVKYMAALPFKHPVPHELICLCNETMMAWVDRCIAPGDQFDKFAHRTGLMEASRDFVEIAHLTLQAASGLLSRHSWAAFARRSSSSGSFTLAAATDTTRAAADGGSSRDIGGSDRINVNRNGKRGTAVAEHDSSSSSSSSYSFSRSSSSAAASTAAGRRMVVACPSAALLWRVQCSLALLDACSMTSIGEALGASCRVMEHVLQFLRTPDPPEEALSILSQCLADGLLHGALQDHRLLPVFLQQKGVEVLIGVMLTQTALLEATGADCKEGEGDVDDDAFDVGGDSPAHVQRLRSRMYRQDRVLIVGHALELLMAAMETPNFPNLADLLVPSQDGAAATPTVGVTDHPEGGTRGDGTSAADADGGGVGGVSGGGVGGVGGGGGSASHSDGGGRGSQQVNNTGNGVQSEVPPGTTNGSWERLTSLATVLVRIFRNWQCYGDFVVNAATYLLTDILKHDSMHVAYVVSCGQRRCCQRPDLRSLFCWVLV